MYCHLKAHNSRHNAVRLTGSYNIIVINTSLVHSCILTTATLSHNNAAYSIASMTCAE